MYPGNPTCIRGMVPYRRVCWGIVGTNLSMYPGNTTYVEWFLQKMELGYCGQQSKHVSREYHLYTWNGSLQKRVLRYCGQQSKHVVCNNLRMYPGNPTSMPVMVLYRIVDWDIVCNNLSMYPGNPTSMHGMVPYRRVGWGIVGNDLDMYPGNPTCMPGMVPYRRMGWGIVCNNLSMNPGNPTCIRAMVPYIIVGCRFIDYSPRR